MTTQKNLKQRIRSRMAKTGESYSAARVRVLGQQPVAQQPGRSQPWAIDTSDQMDRELNLMLGADELTAEDVSALEKRVQSAPDDLEARLQLVAHYDWEEGPNESQMATRREHVLWVLRHHRGLSPHLFPFLQLKGDAEGRETAKEIWRDRAARAGDDATILSNAAAYFVGQDDELARTYFEKAEALDSGNPLRASLLGAMHLRNERAAEALETLAAAACSPEERYYLLPQLAEAAFAAEQWNEAASHCNEMLDAVSKRCAASNSAEPDAFGDGNAVFSGNHILGRLALRRGYVEEAKARLLAAGRTSGSPRLRSVGPDMKLAQELLDRGERTAVQEYIQLCRRFWNLGEETLDEWQAAIRRGESPALTKTEAAEAS